MGCGICAKLNRREKNLVKVYREYYTKYGIEYYAFKTEENGGISFVKKNQFNTIYEREIKPNLHKGADYFHIKEFTG